MPIEEAFSYIKGYLKNHDELLQEYDRPEHVIESAYNSITPDHCKAWINDWILMIMQLNE